VVSQPHSITTVENGAPDPDRCGELGSDWHLGYDYDYASSHGPGYGYCCGVSGHDRYVAHDSSYVDDQTACCSHGFHALVWTETRHVEISLGPDFGFAGVRHEQEASIGVLMRTPLPPPA
jgi:hypothetical protein